MTEADFYNSEQLESIARRGRFHIKGRTAEAWVHGIAFSSFLKDWCIPNPRKDNGKEICDLLVVFGDTILIWQIKDIKYSGNDKRFIRKSIDSSVKQIKGAERTLFSAQDVFDFKNAYDHSLAFDPNAIRTVHRIVASLGEADILLPIAVEDEQKLIHVMDRSLEGVLNELDTVSDFMKYLEDKEALWASGKTIEAESNELDVLADYIVNDKSFEHLHDTDEVYYTSGIWDKVTKEPNFLRKKEEDKISYVWDHIIGELHKSEDPTDYLLMARELAAPNRFRRRALSQQFVSALKESAERRNGFRRLVLSDGAVFVFLFRPVGTDRVERRAELECMCFVARDLHDPIPKVIGIATESLNRKGRSFDVVKYEALEWTPEDRSQAATMRENTGIFARPQQFATSFVEYPQEGESSFRSNPLDETNNKPKKT